MNELSWILYWADVLPSLATAVGITFGVATVGALVLLITWFIALVPPGSEEFREKLGFARWLWVVTLGVALSSNLVPSRETFYAIAVSETGEEVLKSPEVGKARQALNAWLDNQINELSEDGEPVEAQ